MNRIAIIHKGKLINSGEQIEVIKEKYNSLENFYMNEVKGGVQNE